MYLEYKTHMPHNGAMRAFWVVQALMGIVEETSLILEGNSLAVHHIVR